MQHSAIVGASAAGVSAAIAMRSHGYDGRITVIDRDPHPPYERPPLSKLADRTLRPIAPPGRFAELDIELRLGIEVHGVDPVSRTLHLDASDSLRVDALLLSTGVAARRLTVPGSSLSHVLVLRDASDAALLADRLSAGGPLVVVGAGFIGLEIAALARERGLDVTVVEVGARPLQNLDERIGLRALELHQDRGVRFVLGRTVERFEGVGAVEEVVLDDGTRIPAATVVVGVGVEPRTELARAIGVRTDGQGIAVDAYGRTDVSWVYAAGDVASQPHPQLVAGPGRIEHWDVALKHGTAVGATMAGHPTAFTETPYVWSDQFGLTFQMFGRPRTTDELVMRPDSTSKSYLGFWLRDEVVVAVCGLDRPRDVGAARRLVQLPVGAHRDALADGGIELRALIKTMTRG
ncbi:FAD-dependent oxidoreductase [Phytohabitans sp. ZYX-F-186]|uniref:FAD-dependent oxidoreductase n=1 Tax=Phytohabitans maris TaxID=3071409 RepID=A0ABU0ZDY8_9ACTN|nr:FAD-dependent oxidoreductase [Phytohabitans sp. ZYX-F-186]MDQ7905269.1 FAD-dependent oxidoreductase [Phytohabitans sp. ZYX-F-186]